MIHIDEIFYDEERIALVVAGRLDNHTFPSLEAVCNKYLKENKKISLNLKGVTHMNLKSKNFLEEVQREVTLQDIPEFLRLEIMKT